MERAEEEMTLKLSELPIDEFDEHVAVLNQLLSTGEEVMFGDSTIDEEQLAKILSHLPINESEEQVAPLNQSTTVQVGEEAGVSSFPGAEVWINHRFAYFGSLLLNVGLQIATEAVRTHKL